MYTNMYYNNIIIQAHTSAQRMITETYKVVLWLAKEATIRRKTTNTAKMNTHTHTHTCTHTLVAHTWKSTLSLWVL